MKRICIALLTILTAAGCEQEQPTSTDDTKAEQPATQPVVTMPETTDPALWTPAPYRDRIEVAGVRMPKPVEWIETAPLSQMRVANYTVPAEGTSAVGELAIFLFPPGLGGAIDANIQRWRSQFRPEIEGDDPPEPTIGKFVADDLPVTTVELSGWYRKTGAASFTQNQTLLGALIETKKGLLVLLLTGPNETVEENRRHFERMLLRLEQMEKSAESGS